jgi:hypothetical protein
MYRNRKQEDKGIFTEGNSRNKTLQPLQLESIRILDAQLIAADDRARGKMKE